MCHVVRGDGHLHRALTLGNGRSTATSLSLMFVVRPSPGLGCEAVLYFAHLCCCAHLRCCVAHLCCLCAYLYAT